MGQTKPKHVFICLTPLHVLIAAKIIAAEKITSFIFVYYYLEENGKIRHYYNLLSERAAKSFFVKKTSSLFFTITTLLGLSFNIRKIAANKPEVYCGNVKTIYSRFPVYMIGAGKLHTFDDGIGNIIGEGYFYKDLDPRPLSGILSALGLNFSYQATFRRISTHYTIYKSENLMPNCRYIQLFDQDDNRDTVVNNRSIVILITSRLSESDLTSLEKELAIYRDAISEFDIRYWIPHPLENENKLAGEGLGILRSDKIAEEIIMDLRKEFGLIRVIGCYSSTLIHLSGVPGIEIININFEGEGITPEVTKKLFDSHGVKTYYPNIKLQ